MSSPAPTYYELSGNKGQASGYAPLNSSGQLPLSVMPFPITSSEVDTSIVVTSEVGAANGVASLDSTGQLEVSQATNVINAAGSKVVDSLAFLLEMKAEQNPDQPVFEQGSILAEFAELIA